jgi:hypothetical protein
MEIRRSWSVPRLAAFALGGLLLCATASQAQIRTVLVSPVPGNPVASGANLLAALAGIAAPSSTNPWLLKIEPGIYDLQGSSLVMRSWVDVEGSGIGVTIIKGSLNPEPLMDAGVVEGADNAELRGLTIQATAVQGGYVIGMYNENVAPRVHRVKITASGGLTDWGMRNSNAAPIIDEIEVSVTASGTAYGIVYTGPAEANPRRAEIRRSRIVANDATNNYGIFVTTGLYLREIRDSEITALRGTNTYGIAVDSIIAGPAEIMTIDHCEIDALSGSGDNHGVFVGGSQVASSVQAYFVDIQVDGAAGTNRYGIRQNSTGSVNVTNSSLVAATNTVLSLGPLAVGATRLLGGPVTGGGYAGCFGVWDELGIFYPNTCP